MKRILMRRPWCVALLGLLLAGCAAEKPWLTSGQKTEIFDAAWTTIAERHYDPTLGGVDWKQVHAQVAPRVDAATNDAEFLAAMRGMTTALGQSHINVMPPDEEVEREAKQDATAAKPDDAAGATADADAEDGTCGLDVAGIEGAIIVIRVHAGSPAEQAGIHVGDELISAGGTDLTKIKARAQQRSAERWEGFIPYLGEHLLSGKVGESVDVVVRGTDGADRNVKLGLMAPDIPRVHFGTLGAMRADFESRRLDGGVQYIRFTPCFTAVLERVTEALEGARDASGIILDLRGNPGGLGTIAMGVARQFVAEEADLGVMRTRQDEIHFKLNPVPDPYAGPLVVIVDASSASTAEILAAGLQAIGRARVVGRTSMGAALPSIIERLPYGWRLQAVVADYRLPNGHQIEGGGVVPDVVVDATRAAFAAGGDPYLDVARRELATAPRLKPRTAPVVAAAPAADSGPAAAIDASPEAAQVMDGIATAMGGGTRAAALRSVRTKSKLTIMGMSGVVDTLMAAPNKLRVSTSIPAIGETLQVFDGVHAYTSDPMQGLRELTGEELAQIRRQARLDAAAAWREIFAKVEIVERKKDGDREAIILRETPRPGEGEPSTVWVDAATHLPYKTESVTKTNLGKVSSVTEVLEYKSFDGYVDAARVRMTMSNGAKVTIVTESREVNVPVDDALFNKPPAPQPKGRRSESVPASRPGK